MTNEHQSAYRTPLLIAGVIILLLGLGYLAWTTWMPQETPEEDTNEPVFCTQDAMECPDGSFVGRSGPNCEFNPCPSETDATNGESEDEEMDTVTDNDISITYQTTLGTSYVDSADWPPTLVVSNDAYTCDEGTTANGPTITSEIFLGGQTVCKTVMTEGAAGSTYTTYTYTFAFASELVRLEFTLSSPNCQNYDMPEQTLCEAELAAFDVDARVAAMIESTVVSK